MQKVTINCETGEEIWEDLTPDEEAENLARATAAAEAYQLELQQQQADQDKKTQAVGAILSSPDLPDDVKQALMNLLGIEATDVPEANLVAYNSMVT